MDGCRAIFSQTWITDPPIGLYFPFLKDAPNAQLSKRNDGQEDLRRRKAKELPQYFRKVVSAGIFCLCRRHGPQPHRTSAMGTLLMIGSRSEWTAVRRGWPQNRHAKPETVKTSAQKEPETA